MPLNDQRKSAKRAFEKLKECADKFEKKCCLAFPVGSDASYEHGNRLRFVRVMGTSGARIQVVGYGANAKPYWVYAYRLLSEVE